MTVIWLARLGGNAGPDATFDVPDVDAVGAGSADCDGVATVRFARLVSTIIVGSLTGLCADWSGTDPAGAVVWEYAAPGAKPTAKANSTGRRQAMTRPL